MFGSSRKCRMATKRLDGRILYGCRDEVGSFINSRKCGSFEWSVPEKMINRCKNVTKTKNRISLDAEDVCLQWRRIAAALKRKLHVASVCFYRRKTVRGHRASVDILLWGVKVVFRDEILVMQWVILSPLLKRLLRVFAKIMTLCLVFLSSSSWLLSLSTAFFLLSSLEEASWLCWFYVSGVTESGDWRGGLFLLFSLSSKLENRFHSNSKMVRWKRNDGVDTVSWHVSAGTLRIWSDVDNRMFIEIAACDNVGTRGMLIGFIWKSPSGWLAVCWVERGPYERRTESSSKETACSANDIADEWRWNADHNTPPQCSWEQAEFRQQNPCSL